MIYPSEVKAVLAKVRREQPPPTAVAGTGVNFACGCYTRCHLSISEDDGSVREVVTCSNGCGYMLAAGVEIAKQLEGRRLTGLHALPADEIAGRLSFQPPPDRQECVSACVAAVRTALVEYRLRRIAEFEGDTPLICTCFGVTEDVIENVVSQLSTPSVEGVGNACNAGTGCGSCQMLIQEMVEAAVPDP